MHKLFRRTQLDKGPNGASAHAAKARRIRKAFIAATLLVSTLVSCIFDTGGIKAGNNFHDAGSDVAFVDGKQTDQRKDRQFPDVLASDARKDAPIDAKVLDQKQPDHGKDAGVKDSQPDAPKQPDSFVKEVGAPDAQLDQKLTPDQSQKADQKPTPDKSIQKDGTVLPDKSQSKDGKSVPDKPKQDQQPKADQKPTPDKLPLDKKQPVDTVPKLDACKITCSTASALGLSFGGGYHPMSHGVGSVIITLDSVTSCSGSNCVTFKLTGCTTMSTGPFNTPTSFKVDGWCPVKITPGIIDKNSQYAGADVHVN
jgi:hypothetical protein